MKKLLHRPLNYWHINQHFGENQVCIDNATNSKFQWCDGENPPTGWRSVYGDKGHQGIDLQANMWTPVYSAQNGTVYDIDENEKSGYDVRIESTLEGETLRHIYEHLSRWNVKVGDEVVTGQIIGWVGTTGYSTGPHLHLQVEDIHGNKLNPEHYLSDLRATDVMAMNSTIQSVTQQLGIIATIIRHIFSLSTPGSIVKG